MRVINLDKFRNSTQVIIAGVQYEVNSVTVGMYLNDVNFATIASGTLEEQRVGIESIVSTIQNISNIPREVLLSQSFPMLVALIQVAQGIDPTAEPEKSESEGEVGNVQ